MFCKCECVCISEHAHVFVNANVHANAFVHAHVHVPVRVYVNGYVNAHATVHVKHLKIKCTCTSKPNCLRMWTCKCKCHCTFKCLCAKHHSAPFTPQEPHVRESRTIQLVPNQFVVTDKYRYYSYLGSYILPTKT